MTRARIALASRPHHLHSCLHRLRLTHTSKSCVIDTRARATCAHIARIARVLASLHGPRHASDAIENLRSAPKQPSVDSAAPADDVVTGGTADAPPPAVEAEAPVEADVAADDVAEIEATALSPTPDRTRRRERFTYHRSSDYPLRNRTGQGLILRPCVSISPSGRALASRTGCSFKAGTITDDSPCNHKQAMAQDRPGWTRAEVAEIESHKANESWTYADRSTANGRRIVRSHGHTKRNAMDA